MPAPATTVDVDGYEIRVSNPDKVLFPEIGVTKMDLVEYYLAVAEAALIGCRDRPTIMHRFPNGVDGEPFYQKRVPAQRPPWVQTATITFPSGRHAVMIAPADAAHLVWMANLACLDINPWPVRSDDVDHPDELRVDLDPTPGVPWGDVRDVTMLVREVLEEHGAVGFPATSGKRGMHLVVPIVREHGFTNVRRAALALAREVTRRAPGVATAAWWKEERQGVFVDYNQNARDRTVASVYSVRPVPDARVATPLSWDEVPDVDPSVFTIKTVPDRLASIGDPGAGADPVERSSLDGLLALAAKDEAGGLGDAPWPPHFPKGDSEPVRVNPSRAKKVAEWEASRRREH